MELEATAPSLASRFEHAAKLFGADALDALPRLSYFVGMVCPGLHSVFSSLQFGPGSATAGELRFEVRKYDPRFRLFIVAFDGPISGELRAFSRPPPQPQASSREVAQRLHGDEFNGSLSLVVGGSRGLGEITAKIIAAGGGDVVVSYASGRADAEAVVDDINAMQRGRCSAVHIDLRAGFNDGIGVDPAELNALYYFATPRIFAKRGALFDRGAFDEFATFYLSRFHQLCLLLDRTERTSPLQVYLPSTVAIDARPRGMTEYTMAKAAAEVLADDLNRELHHVHIVHTRLPRLATDQTASILQAAGESNIDVMLAVVRRMNG